MASKVEFKSTLELGHYEIRSISEDDFVINPKTFQNSFDDNAHVVLVDQYGMLYLDEDTTSKPVYYMRHALIDDSRFGGVIVPGDDCLSPQISGDCDSFYQRGPITDCYKKLNDNPFEYGYSTENPYSQFQFKEDYSTWREADVLDLKATYLGHSIVDHQASFKDLPQIIMPVKIEGTYRGRKVIGLGEWAKNYQKEHKKENILSNLGYICLDLMGIRHDGRLEHTFISIDHTGSVGALYTLEGEEPVVANSLTFEAEWERLPYVDDGTCTFREAIIRFGGKEIHFNAKWGTKGITNIPRLEKHGQSHIFGTWYEGTKSYDHKLNFSFIENMEVFDYKLKEMGFDIKD